MPTITIKNVPDDLYELLKQRARRHRRSINSEIIHCLEEIIFPHRIDSQELLEAARKIRKKTTAFVTDAFINEEKTTGRP